VRTIFDHLKANWSAYAIPLTVFIVSIIALFWVRRLALAKLEKWTEQMKWPEENFLIQSVRGPSSLLCLIFSLYLGLSVSIIPPSWKNPSGNGLWTLFIIALTISLLHLARSFTLFYGKKLNLSNQAILVSRNVIRTAILIVALLIILDIWGVPTSPLLLLIAVAILVAALAFRDAVPNLFASFQIAATQEIKAGDYIKLDSQEEGYVIEISWNNTRVKALDGSIILIPNNMLIRRKVINYGRPLKKARLPFRFNTHAHLAELTGLRAKNLTELITILKKAPEAVVYYHTHHYIELHQYLVPELINDFANWVKNSLDNQVLGERLADISIIEFTSLSTFRDKLVNIIETYLAQDSFQRDVLSGREFYFMRSVDVILPTNYTAHDLREFVEAVRKITPASLYFHVFESRMRLNTASNDFAIWLANDMDEKELSQEIAKIDPYTYTLEGLRSLLIQIIEKHIK
jgi:small-conductance mechanosensitive channel